MPGRSIPTTPTSTPPTSACSRSSSPIPACCRAWTAPPPRSRRAADAFGPDCHSMAQIDQLLEEVLKRRGSDLHFLAADPPRIRMNGELSPLRGEPLTAEFTKETLYEIMPRKAIERFDSKDGADFAYTLEGKGRFRVNVMRQLNGMGAV